MSDDKSGKDKGAKHDDAIGKLVLVLAGACLVLAALPLAAVAAAAYFGARRWLTKTHFAVLGTVGVIGLALNPAGDAIAYGKWLQALVTSHGDRWNIPWLPLLLVGLIGAAACALIQGTKLGAAIPARFGRGEKDDPFAEVSVLPTADEKHRARSVSLPGGVLAPDLSAQSFMTAPQRGGRFIPLGHDRNGQPVGITEKELGMHGVILGGTGSGKALALDTPIPTPGGWSTMGELEPGDQVFDENGRPCRVVFATEVQLGRTCYEVEFSDGSVIVADAEHRWLTWDIKTRKAYDHAHKGAAPYPEDWAAWASSGPGPQPYAPGEREKMRAWRAEGLTAAEVGERLGRTADAISQQWNRPEKASARMPVTTTEIASSLRLRGRNNHAIPAAKPICCGEEGLPIDPYVLGYLLGDGDTKRGGRVACDPRDRDWLLAEFNEAGYDSAPYGDEGHFGVRGISGLWRELGLQSNKHIPKAYLRASVDQRIALVQGLVDSDGWVDNHGAYRFTNTNRELIDGFCELVASLGGIPRISSRIGRLRAGKPVADSWEVIVPTELPLARLPRKVEAARKVWKREQVTRFITDVRPVPSVPVRCIQVDSPNHLYLAGRSFIPTHNTETIKQLMGGLLDLGWSGLLLDLKEDTKPIEGLRDWCKFYAGSHAIPFQQIALSDENPDFWFNPLHGISADEARDSILSLVEFDDQFWQNLNRKMLGQVMNLTFAAHQVDPENFPYPTPRTIGELLEKGPQIKTATKAMRAAIQVSLPGVSMSDFAMMANPTDDAAKSAQGFGMRLTNIYDTVAGKTVLTPNDARRLLDVTRPGLTYIGLDSLGKPDLTRLVSSSVLQRMSVEAAHLTQKPPATGVKQRFLIVDEANWVARDIVMNLLSRARSAGITVILCTQGPHDWDDDWQKMVNNINVGVIMSQGSDYGASLAADFIGMTEQVGVSQQVREGEVMESGTLRKETVHYVPPHRLRAMGIGEAILRVTKPEERITWLSVKQRDPHGGPRLS